ncbi:MAG: hypothetical protein H6Q08_1505 [Acidobacteria bacterium]|nr:hypothetical protein [Acidobacteriota bacterium]
MADDWGSAPERCDDMASLVDRMMGAARLDVKTYEEVEADQNALGQAMTVVVLSAVAAGIGNSMRMGVNGLIFGTLISLIGWFIWALLTWLIGTKVLPEANTHADMGQMLRTIGFSASPGVLQVLGIIPFLGVLINFLISVWMLIAMVIAVRQALDYSSTGRAVGVVFIGWLVNLFVTASLFAVFGLGALALGSLTGN